MDVKQIRIQPVKTTSKANSCDILGTNCPRSSTFPLCVCVWGGEGGGEGGGGVVSMRRMLS